MAINVMLSRNPFSFSQHIVLSISLLLPLFLSLTRLTFRPAVSEALIKPSTAAANDDLPQTIYLCVQLGAYLKSQTRVDRATKRCSN